MADFEGEAFRVLLALGRGRGWLTFAEVNAWLGDDSGDPAGVDRLLLLLEEEGIELLDKVGIPRARDRLDSYPHEFSGGMRQRVMIALALSCNPSILIADEPTTALDVVVQRDIIEQIVELKNRLGFSVLFITHDLGLMIEFCDRI